ncbi:hypothetical protein NK718_10640 [Alsobacter sp. SYSU M60028]|uniref:Universal stress protein n=1 Tax=Alsobacter ponti TaxID=2962936 RepID=A0ABT1LBY2_9HYPH|nr:hypothetical protein [Alsobacter ponti]MCP8938974.1 hypothetical protein [Alsobacter ponti]
MSLVVLAAADGGPLTAQVVETALQLRSVLGGYCKAFHVRDRGAYLPTAFGLAEGPAVFDEQWAGDLDERAEHAARVWAERNTAGDDAVFHDVNGEETGVLVANARVSDIAVVARPGSDVARPEPGYVNGLVFESGRPILVVPPTVSPRWMEDGLIVWNGSAQAARAVGAALPLLRRARRVRVVSFGRETSRAPTGALVSYLSRHGIAAEAAGVDPGGVTSRGRGRAVVNYAFETGTGFTVMGAYGEQGLMSFLGLGAATAKVITGTRVPLLLAH